MVKKATNWVAENWFSQPMHVKILILLIISAFLPFYITLPTTIITLIFILSSKKRVKIILHSQFAKIFACLSIVLLITPLFYNNFFGFIGAILFCIYLIIELYISGILTVELFDLLCRLCSFLSLFNAAIAMTEKIFGLQGRVMAFTDNPNYYAYMVELTVLVSLYKFVTSRKPIYILIFGSNIAAIILTECRSALPGLFVGLLVFLWISDKRKSILVLTVFISIFAMALYFDPYLLPRYGVIESTIKDRLGIWKLAYRDFLRHPLFGRGLLAYFQISGKNMTLHAHNIVIELLESTGIIGTALFGMFFYAHIYGLIKCFQKCNVKQKSRVALSGAVIAATLAHGLTDMPLIGIQTGLLFFILVSLRPCLQNK